MNKKAFVLDTNVLLRDPQALFSFEDNDIFLPLVVIQELDGLKNANGQAGFSSREVSRTIGDMLEKGDISNGVQIANGLGRLYVRDYSSKQEKNDDVIIEFAKNLNTIHNNVILVSKDVNVRIKADALGVKCQDYKKDLITDVRPVSEYTFTVPKEMVSALYSEGIATVDAYDYDTSCHYFGQYCLLKAKYNPKMGCIARFKSGVFYRVDDIDSVYDITPKNAEQRMLIDAIMDKENDVVFGVGLHGSGKSLISLACSLSMVENGDFKKIMLVKSVIPVGGKAEEIGFLPGSQEDKLGPYFASFDDNLEFIAGEEYVQFIEQGVIDKQPLTFMRGRTLNDTILILDEAQNLEIATLKTLVSRMGQGSKMIILGDPYQIDNPYLNSLDNGLVLAIEALKREENVSVVNLLHNTRSRISALAEKL